MEEIDKLKKVKKDNVNHNDIIDRIDFGYHHLITDGTVGRK